MHGMLTKNMFSIKIDSSPNHRKFKELKPHFTLEGVQAAGRGRPLPENRGCDADHPREIVDACHVECQSQDEQHATGVLAT